MPLSDVLSTVRLTGVYYYVIEGARPWSAATVPAANLQPRVLPRAERVIAFHVMCRGSCWTGLDLTPAIQLGEGDVVMYPHGDSHCLASAPSLGVGATPMSI